MLDAQLIFSDAQNITANATTVDSTNIIDTGVLYDHTKTALLNNGDLSGKPRLIVSVAVKPDAGTGLQVEFHDCATVGGTYKPTGIGVNSAIPIATLVAGYEMINTPMPTGLMRFLKLVYTTTGNHTGSAGCIDAYIGHKKSKNQTPYRA